MTIASMGRRALAAATIDFGRLMDFSALSWPYPTKARLRMGEGMAYEIVLMPSMMAAATEGLHP